MPFSVAMDGPVGAGKSTVADAVAKELGIIHLDTGAMYRAIGLYALENNIDPNDEDAVSDLCENGSIRVDVRYENGKQCTLLCGKDVSGLIREQQVGDAASKVSRYAKVRELMVKSQQQIAQTQSILIDGRDICTVVLPNADVKIYLTASAEKRAERRRLQLLEKGKDIPFEEILKEVNDRDWQDMHREVTPLRIAEDAVVIDTSDCDFETSVRRIVDLVKGVGRNV